MRLDGLRKPVSDGAPSGPDLEEAGDYSNYMLLASALLPARFLTRSTGNDGIEREVPFDKSTIDADSEVATIAGFLERTRDIRLLTLEARFQALSGSIVGFTESLQGLAIIVVDFWDSFHPTAPDGDYLFRQNTLEGLEDRAQIVLPLLYAPLVGTGNQAITYRHYMVASDKAKARPGEVVLSLDAVLDGLAEERNREQVMALGEAVQAGLSALTQIRDVFVERAGHVNAPSFELLEKTLADIGKLLASSRPDLVPTPAAASADGDAAAPVPAAGDAPAPGLAGISSHAEAAAALAAAELYFQTYEPSAPALILIHQARMLLGKPLIATLEALFPETAASAVLRFDSVLRFDLGLTQMKLVTDDALLAGIDPLGGGGDKEFAAGTRAEASTLLQGIEAFYRTAEPSSPAPMLLAKARSYLGKDFSALLNEILPRERQYNQ